jgi:RNA polymerase sigma-70 factor (ECF subfamily)
MNSAANLRRLSIALGLKRVSVKGRSQLRARLSKQKQSSSPTEHTLANAKPDSLNASPGSEAIRLAQQGDAEAFETIYHEHSGRVYALCLRMLRDPIEAQDLTQDVFLQLFRKIQTFRGASAFSTWLYRLTVNMILMRLRRKTPGFVPLDDTMPSDDQDTTPFYQITTPDLRLAGLVDRITIQAALDRLPEGYKQIFILHDVQGYKHSEIAEILRHSIGNSKSQLHKARKRLRELLQEARPSKPGSLAKS